MFSLMQIKELIGGGDFNPFISDRVKGEEREESKSLNG